MKIFFQIWSIGYLVGALIGYASTKDNAFAQRMIGAAIVWALLANSEKEEK